MAGTIVVDRIEADSSYSSTINVASQINFTSVPSIGGITARFGLRNKLINGNFDLWQRSTSASLTTSSFPAPDRWLWVYDGTSSSTNTVSRQTFPLGQTDVPGNPKYFMRYTYGVTSTPNNYFRQDIEGVATLAGKTVTVSCWARCSSGTVSASFQNQQEFGSGGSPSSGVYGIGQTAFTITTSWQKFTFTHTLPSVSGKTIGTNNDDHVNPSFYFPTDAGNTVDFAQIQMEEGPVATSFEERPIGLETSLCQRYYYKGALYGGGCSSGSTSQYIGVSFPTTMRANPSVSWVSGGRIGNGSTDTAVTGLSALIGTGPTNASINFTTSTFGSAAQGIVLYNQPIIVLDAEI